MLIRDIKIEKKVWSAEQAFHYCERLTSEHYENFPVASLFIPSDKRRYVYSIYAFARTADDYADEPGLTPAERIESLNEWDEQLTECYLGKAQHPVFVALRETVERFEIPQQLFQDLLQAFRSDVTTHRYETFEDVLAYCSCSANPVGRLILLLFNYRSEGMMSYSDSMCTALQLTNFWQDVSIDLQKNRIYIPLEDLREFGCTEEDLFGHNLSRGFKDLLAFEIERTAEMFREGEPLLTQVGKDLSFELKLTWNGGMKILEKLERNEFDVFKKRPTLNAFDKARLLLSSLAH